MTISFSILTVLASCMGQNQVASSTLSNQNSLIAEGDTVTELGNNLMNVFQDKNNNYWFGSNGEGLYKYDGKTITHFTTKDGLWDNQIGKIQEDKKGNIYFNSQSGISKYDGQSFTKLTVRGDSESAWSLDPDDLWFSGAQDSGVVYRYDGETLHRLVFPTTKEGDRLISQFPRSKFPNMVYSPYDVYTIYKDMNGILWFGTTSLGVCRYDGETFTWISEKELEFDVGTAFGIRSIIKDDDGKFWFSNTLHRFKMLEDGSYVKEKGLAGVDKKNFDIEAIISMSKVNGDLWMASFNKGVLKFDGQQITHYPIKNNGTVVTLFSIYKDNNDDLWLGTHENGVYKFNGEKFERFQP